MASPVISARISSVRVFMAPSSRPAPTRSRGEGGPVNTRRHGSPDVDGYNHAAFERSVHRSSLPTIPGFPRVKDRAEQLMGKARDAVPEGTFAVGGGLMITALTTYVFLIVANQALPDKPYASLTAFWGLIFVAGPGLFLPLEQEVGRAVAHRRAPGLGGGPPPRPPRAGGGGAARPPPGGPGRRGAPRRAPPPPASPGCSPPRWWCSRSSCHRSTPTARSTATTSWCWRSRSVSSASRSCTSRGARS